MLQSMYDSTDRIADAIEQLIGYLGLDDSLETGISPLDERWDTQDTNSVAFSPYSASSENSLPAINNWSDVLLRRRSCYLRIVLTLDIMFSKGEFPKETDFPECLQTSHLSAYLPLYKTNSGRHSIERTARTGSWDNQSNTQEMNEGSNNENNGTVIGAPITPNSTAPPCRISALPRRGAQNRHVPGSGFQDVISPRMEFANASAEVQDVINPRLESWGYGVTSTDCS